MTFKFRRKRFFSSSNSAFSEPKKEINCAIGLQHHHHHYRHHKNALYNYVRECQMKITPLINNISSKHAMYARRTAPIILAREQIAAIDCGKFNKIKFVQYTTTNVYIFSSAV